jgi:hypothetical protein
MYDVARLLWHKTRRRSLHEVRGAYMGADVADCYAAMCNQPEPSYSPVPCDWRIAKASAQNFRAMILDQDTIYMSVLIGEVLKESPALEKDFFEACAPLGRDTRCRDFVLSATRFYHSWKKEPDDELAVCPFPPAIDAQAQKLFPDLLKFLVQWSLPRMDAIEEAFRARILSDEYCVNLSVFSMIERCETSLKLTPRFGPPLPRLLPAVACLRIQREVERFARNMAGCPDNEEQRDACDQALDEALYEILHHYREILHAQGLSERAVILDIHHHDMPNGPEAILGKYVSFSRKRPV